MSADARLSVAAAALGLSVDEPLQIGGLYAPAVRAGDRLNVSGQVPRVGSRVVCMGRVGAEVSLEDAQQAARICAARALIIAWQMAGTLHALRPLKMGVYVQCSEEFTQISEVGDGASQLLVDVFGPGQLPARTSVGVFRLPKGAAVEVELELAIDAQTP